MGCITYDNVIQGNRDPHAFIAGKLQLSSLKSILKSDSDANWPEQSVGLNVDRLTLNFSKNASIEIAPWDQGLEAWNIINGSRYSLPKDIKIKLFEMDSMLVNYNDCIAFINHIPETIQRIVKLFEANQFSMLQWIAQDECAYDLALHNPILLWLLTGAAQRKPLPKDILSYKQHEILKWLNCLPLKSSIRWLKSLKPDRWNQYDAGSIICCLKTETIINRLRKLPNATPAIGKLLTAYPELLNTRIPEHIDASLDEDQLMEKFDNIRMYLRDTSRLGHQMDVTDIAHRIRQSRSKDEIINLHNQLSKEYTDRHNSIARNEIFPEGSLADDDSVQQIRSTYELFQEGKTMHHCVASYAPLAKIGKRFYYRILAPERLTMEINVNDTEIVVLQCKGYCNRTPKQASLTFIKQWFAENSPDKTITFKKYE